MYYVQVAGVILIGLLLVCVLSRMTMAESALGGYARGQVLITLRRLLKECDTLMQISRQDTDPLVALLHNAEAAANLRAAKKISRGNEFSQKHRSRLRRLACRIE